MCGRSRACSSSSFLSFVSSSSASCRAFDVTAFITCSSTHIHPHATMRRVHDYSGRRMHCLSPEPITFSCFARSSSSCAPDDTPCNSTCC